MLRTVCFFLLMFCIVVSSVHGQTNGIAIERDDRRVSVQLDDELFAQYDFMSFPKPVLYPLMAPGGVAITRHYPMKQDVDAEAQDHPHHKSVWFAHGDMNGVDFWSEKGKILCDQIDAIATNSFAAHHTWLSSDRTPICTDRTEISFDYGENWRQVDYHISLTASEGDLKFGDTKEGTFAIRTHPNLRLVDKENKPAGTAINSERVEGRDVWGKKAKWVHYRGTIDGTVYGITIMDHPDNLRHPTTWHAREYGLVAANPFGLHHFQNQPSGTGDHTIPSGAQLDFRYRIFITRGDYSVEQLESEYKKFAR